MKRIRLYSILLAAATGAFILYALVGGEYRTVPMLGTGLGVLVLLAGAVRFRRVPFVDRWLVVAAAFGYSLLLLLAIGVHYLQRGPVTDRVALSLLMMLGLLLGLRAAYVTTRKRQYGFHNYFDRPARS